MKRIVLVAAMMMAATGVQASAKHMVCDVHSVVMLGDEITQVREQRGNGAQIIDNGRQFQIIMPGGIIITSPVLTKGDNGVERGFKGVAFIKKNGTYLVSADTVEWLLFDGCKK